MVGLSELRIGFLGGRPLGGLCLQELVQRKANIVFVVPNKDEFIGDAWFEPEWKSTVRIAWDAGIPPLEFERFNEDLARTICAAKADIVFSIFFLEILKKDVLEAPPRGCVNIHFAPLPRYRGYYPQMHAILNGESKHGVTMHYMNEAVDAGDVILSREVPVEKQDTGASLYYRCVGEGFKLFQDALHMLEHDIEFPRRPQDERAATYYRKVLPNERRVDLSKSPAEVDAFVRAMTFPPFPPPWFALGDRRFTVAPAPAED